MKTLKNIVERINSETGNDSAGGFDSRGAESQAAEYAVGAAEEAGYGLDDSNLEAHLEVLASNGAKFDEGEALKIAKKSQ